jgi:arylsulfatase A-like enzyme/Tfp pilus assembly protein PilF
MSANGFALVLMTALLLPAACSRSKDSGSTSSDASSPNIILITVDTLRPDHLGCYGYGAARTANIDRLAMEGVRVEHAIAPTPLTLPSHTSILTGLDPPAHGVRDNGTYRVPEAVETLAERLKSEGYQTQAFVSAEVLHSRYNLDQGFDGYDDELWTEAGASDFMYRERAGHHTMDRAVEWLTRRASESTKDAPFFVWLHLFDPHVPYDPPEADARLSPTPYDGEIASVDRQIGRLLAALEQQEVLDETILAFTSDHGESLGEHQEATHAIFIYESTVHVPLIFRYPRKLPAHRIYAGAARSADIMPTLLALAGKRSNPTQGRDLSRALAGASPAQSVAQYSESFHPKLAFGMAPLQGVRLDEWTYIRAPRPELYNREADPMELRNLLEVAISDDVKAQAAKLESLLTKSVEDGGRFGLVSEARPLDPQTLEMLQALGYMGDSQTQEDLGGMDPKDGVQIFEKVEKAIVLSQQGDWASAAPLLASVLEQLPGHVHARNVLAMCEVRMGNLQAAREHFLKSLAQKPQQGQVLLELGRLDFAEGQYQSARRRFSETLELLPDSVEALILMGYLESVEGHTAKAAEWYERAIAADPSRPDTYLHQGDVEFQNRRFKQAQGWYEKAIGVSPRNFSASFQAGLCAFYLGDLGRAERHLLRASETDTNRWEPLYTLACLRARRRDADAALTHLESAAARGFDDSAQLQRDPCMASLSTEPRFLSLVRALGGTIP